MGKLFRCCCTCEGCGKGTLASLPAAFGKMQWHFGGLDFDLPSHPYHPLRKDLAVSPPDDCESGCSEHYEQLSTWLSGTFEWQPFYQYCCCRDVDGENLCQRGKVFLRPVMSGTLRVSFHRGRAYQGCDESNAEICGYLVVAKFIFDYAMQTVAWNTGNISGECATLAAYPDPEDIPPDEDLVDGSEVLIGGNRWLYTSSPTGLNEVVGGSGAVTRVIFVEDLNADAELLEKDEEVALVLSALKHQPECCDLWDCNAELDCSSQPEFVFSIDAPANPNDYGGGPAFCGGAGIGVGGDFLVEWESFTVSWDLDGGIWGIWNVP